MPETTADPTSILLAAIEVAQPAAEVLLSHFDRLNGGQVQTKGSVRDLLTIADQQSEAIVVQGVIERFDDHTVLAEEDGLITPDGTGELSGLSDWLWVVDPLDGTMNFARSHPFFAVSIGVLHRGVPVAAVVWAPRLGEVWCAARDAGAWLFRAGPFAPDPEPGIAPLEGLPTHVHAAGLGLHSGRRLSVSQRGELSEAILATGFSYNRNLVSRNNVDNFSKLVLSAADIRRAGAASVDLAYVASGRLDGYWEAYLKPWDVAAGALLVQEAGGLVTGFGGEDAPLEWLWSEHLVASNRQLHPSLVAALSGTEPNYQPSRRLLGEAVSTR